MKPYRLITCKVQRTTAFQYWAGKIAQERNLPRNKFLDYYETVRALAIITIFGTFLAL